MFNIKQFKTHSKLLIKRPVFRKQENTDLHVQTHRSKYISDVSSQHKQFTCLSIDKSNYQDQRACA